MEKGRTIWCIELHAKINIFATLGFWALLNCTKTRGCLYKSSKLHPLTQPQKKANRQQAKERVGGENRNRDYKLFGIVKEV